MKSEQETRGTEANPHDGPVLLPPRQRYPEVSEAAYERLSAYAFARRYVKGKTVADIVIGRQEGAAEAGSLLLARSAGSVELLLSSGSPETVDPATASDTHPAAPNVICREVKQLPALPFAGGRFDVVVAFGALEELERPEALLAEAKRVLKQDGVLLLSARDKSVEAEDGGRFHEGGADGAGGRRGMYVGELRELLGRHFGAVRIYRQGAVAGGLIFPDTEPDGTAEGGVVVLDIARFSSAEAGPARLGARVPPTRSVVAVCREDDGWGAPPGPEGRREGPYLLLDQDRGVFGENEDLAEDVRLMLGEIEQMQQGEVQAFLEALRAQRHQNLAELQRRYLFHLRGYVGRRREAAREEALHVRNLLLEEVLHRRNIVYGNIRALRKKGLKGSVEGALRRSASLYRRLAARDGNPD